MINKEKCMLRSIDRVRLTLLVVSALCVFCACFPQELQAQQRDAGIWLSASGKAQLNPLWSVVLSEELRLQNNMSEVGSVFTDAGMEYAPLPGWRFSLNYRLILKQRVDRTFSTRHRGYFDARYRHRFQKAELIGRVRFQQQYADMFSSAEGLIPDYYLRSELSWRYRMAPAFRPGLSIEVFQPLSPRNWPDPDQLRLTCNLRWELNKAHAMDLFWIYQQEFNVKRPETDFVVGVGYVFSPRNLF
jgi:hypothetical protein